tara:strand:+ start:1443 stop:1745 length:303 start_codon:yes stop_codon:yes gene_type:complete
MKVNNKNQKLVDELFNLEADKQPIQDKIDAIKAQLKATGAAEYRGTIGYALVSIVFTKRIDWKKIAMRLKASRQLIRSNTSEAESLRVNLNGYNDSKRAA